VRKSILLIVHDEDYFRLTRAQWNPCLRFYSYHWVDTVACGLLVPQSTHYFTDLHLEFESEGRLRTKLYDKRDDFNFPIVNFPFVCSNIPAAPAYGVYLSQECN
jgi:hypothetical protein